MPGATKKEASAYPLPADTMLPAKLVSVEEKKREFFYKEHHQAVQKGRAKVGDKGEIHRWNWKFEVTEGEYAGTWVYGETQPELTDAEDNLVNQWGEALRGRPYEIGEGMHTDDLLGLPCVITVRHGEPYQRRDGNGKFYPCEVDQVFRPDVLASLNDAWAAAPTAATAQISTDDPPF